VEIVAEYLSRSNTVIDLFNRTVDGVMEVVGHDFSDYPSFPEHLTEFVDTKMQFPIGFQHFPSHWKEIDVKLVLELLKALKITSFYSLQSDDRDTLRTKLREFVAANMPVITNLDRMIMRAMLFFDQPQSARMWIGIFRVILTEYFEKLWKNCHEGLPTAIVYRKPEFTSHVSLKWFLEKVKKGDLKLKRPNESPENLWRAFKKRRSGEVEKDEPDFNETIKEIEDQLNKFSSPKRTSDNFSKENEYLVKIRDKTQYLEDNKRLWAEFAKKING